MSNLNIAIVGTDTAAGKLLLEKLEESSMEIEVLYRSVSEKRPV